METGMDWIQILAIMASTFTIIGSTRAMFFWSRSESRSDYRAFTQEIRSWKQEIDKETKDFHGRLCRLEEKLTKKD